jgi:hypothetical protein
MMDDWRDRVVDVRRFGEGIRLYDPRREHARRRDVPLPEPESWRGVRSQEIHNARAKRLFELADRAIAERGGFVTGCLTDRMLRREYGRLAMERLRAKPRLDARDKREIARDLHTCVVRGEVKLCDAQVWYYEGSRALALNLEAESAPFRPGHRAAKEAAGFVVARAGPVENTGHAGRRLRTAASEGMKRLHGGSELVATILRRAER